MRGIAGIFSTDASSHVSARELERMCQQMMHRDMGFVGPRPERPEFVQWLTDKIPYYNLRHIRPGITGWAQVRYRYGASVEDTKRKLEYDLYYIKHMSLTLELFIIFETVKTVVLRRGAQ